MSPWFRTEDSCSLERICRSPDMPQVRGRIYHILFTFGISVPISISKIISIANIEKFDNSFKFQNSKGIKGRIQL